MLQWLGRVAEPVTTAGIVLLFVILILLDRDDLRDRLLQPSRGGPPPGALEMRLICKATPY